MRAAQHGRPGTVLRSCGPDFIWVADGASRPNILGYFGYCAAGAFAQKRRIFPRWFIAMQTFNAAFVLSDIIGAHFMVSSSTASAPVHMQNLIGPVIGCGVWIPYMLMSQRVKTTFVR
jgi:hypothetical protein